MRSQDPRLHVPWRDNEKGEGAQNAMHLGWTRLEYAEIAQLKSTQQGNEGQQGVHPPEQVLREVYSSHEMQTAEANSINGCFRMNIGKYTLFRPTGD